VIGPAALREIDFTHRLHPVAIAGRVSVAVLLVQSVGSGGIWDNLFRFNRGDQTALLRMIVAKSVDVVPPASG